MTVHELLKELSIIVNQHQRVALRINNGDDYELSDVTFAHLSSVPGQIGESIIILEAYSEESKGE